MSDFGLKFRSNGVEIYVSLRELKESRLGIPPNELAFYRNELIHIFRTAVEDGNFHWHKGLTQSLTSRMSRYLDILNYESNDESQFYEKYDTLKAEISTLASAFVKYLEHKAKKRQAKAKHLSKAMFLICCVLGLDFEFLCRTIVCPPPGSALSDEYIQKIQELLGM